MMLGNGWGFWVSAGGRFPPPEFTGGYRMPGLNPAPPPAAWLAWLDVAMLALALAAMIFFAHRKSSRRGILGVAVFSVFYFGFYRHGCVCSVGALQNVALAAANANYDFPWTVAAFFVLPLAAALFWGRVFCAGVCPLGALQELVLWRPVKIPAWLERGLRLFAWAYLGLAVLLAATGTVFVICRYDPFVLFFRLHGSFSMLMAGLAVLALAAVVGRPYCRFLCPYGVLLRICAGLARWPLRLMDEEECAMTRICYQECPYGAILRPVPEKEGGLGFGHGRLALVFAVGLAAVLVGGWLGWRAAPELARWHATVALAERVALENAGKVKGTTLESRAFRQLGLPADELLSDALRVRRQFQFGAPLMGVFVGMCLAGAFWRSLRSPPARAVFSIDPSFCLVCARCLDACPVLKKRRIAAIGE